MLSTFELLSTQNTLLTAKTQALYAQYDYVFKMKVAGILQRTRLEVVNRSRWKEISKRKSF
jgi:hypothetical protein